MSKTINSPVGLTTKYSGAHRIASVDSLRPLDATIDGTNGSDSIDGTSDHDSISGMKGDDTINGMAGRDTLNGNDGNDYIDGGQNDDQINGGRGFDFLFGNNGDDVLNGNASDDTLIGGRGNDTLNGGSGFDLAVFTDLTRVDTSGVTVDLNTGIATGETFGTDSLMFIEGVIGSDADDTIIGDENDNYLSARGGTNDVSGGDGNDTVTGSMGTYDGGAGDDLVIATGAGAILTGGDGNDQVQAQGGGSSDGGAGDDTVFGSGGDDVLSGGDGNDFIRIIGGAATVDAGAGDDLVFAGIGGDAVIEGGDGTDMISFFDTYYTPANIKIDLRQEGPQDTGAGVMTITGFENAVGGSYDDRIIGNTGDNLLSGDWGDDALRGADGNDTIYGDAYFVSDGAGGTVMIDGYAASPFFSYNDTIDGGRGDDVINGGYGGDELRGNKGHDTFVYDDLSDSMASNRDTIHGLQNGDIIDLSAIDAISGTPEDDAFVLVDAFTGTAGEVTIGYDGTMSILKVDVDGDGTADMSVNIDGDHRDFDNFVL